MSGIFYSGPETTDIRQVLFEMFFLAAAAAAAAFFGQNTPVMSALIPALILVRFLLIRRRYDLVFLIIGIVAGGGNDVMSMARDVYRYTPPTLLPVPIPVWMLLLWGQIFVAFRQLFLLPVFQGAPHEGSPWRINLRLILDLITVIALRIIIYNFVRMEPIPTAAYGLVIFARLAALPPRGAEWALMAVTTILGIAYEAILIHFGLYIYYDPVFLGMPGWLMIYWVFMIPIFVKGIFDRVEAALK